MIIDLKGFIISHERRLFGPGVIEIDDSKPDTAELGKVLQDRVSQIEYDRAQAAAEAARNDIRMAALSVGDEAEGAAKLLGEAATAIVNATLANRQPTDEEIEAFLARRAEKEAEEAKAKQEPANPPAQTVPSAPARPAVTPTAR